MPKPRKQFDPWERYRGAMVGRMYVMDYGLPELAARLGISVPTARKYIKDPGSMTMDQMRAVNRALDITAESARELIAVK